MTRAVPSILLLAVAAAQIYLAYGLELLTPAKGGGFGMFATVDRLNNRHFVARAGGDGWEAPVQIAADPALRSAMRTMLSSPSKRHMEAFAARLVTDVAQGKRAFDADPQNAGRPGFGKPLQHLRVTVYKRAFEASDGQARAVRVRECLFDLDASKCR